MQIQLNKNLKMLRTLMNQKRDVNENIIKMNSEVNDKSYQQKDAKEEAAVKAQNKAQQQLADAKALPTQLNN